MTIFFTSTDFRLELIIHMHKMTHERCAYIHTSPQQHIYEQEFSNDSDEYFMQ